MKLFRAWTTLVWLSFRRLFWSLNTFMVMFPLVGAGLFIVQQRGKSIGRLSAVDAFGRFSDVFVIQLFTLFLLPICALAFATTSIGGDREDRTLLFLLVRPIPRWLILFAKWSATLPLVLALIIGSFYIYCRLAGSAADGAFRLYLPAVFLMTVAYVSLFHLFAVMFRHATITALVYALFMEALLGNMPGVIKRVAISFYGRSMMYREVGRSVLPEPTVFESLAVSTAAWSLGAIAIGSLLLAAVVFSRREYRDLT